MFFMEVRLFFCWMSLLTAESLWLAVFFFYIGATFVVFGGLRRKQEY